MLVHDEENVLDDLRSSLNIRLNMIGVISELVEDRR